MREFTFETFASAARVRGFDDVLERTWPASSVIDTHTHAFAVHALLVAGEMWLTIGGQERHLLPGETFTLDADVPHEERYGAEGATYWVARRSAPHAGRSG